MMPLRTRRCCACVQLRRMLARGGWARRRFTAHWNRVQCAPSSHRPTMSSWFHAHPSYACVAAPRLYSHVRTLPRRCLAALHAFRVQTLVYAAPNARMGAVESAMKPHTASAHPYHSLEVRSGVLADRSAELMRAFFQRRRNEGARAWTSEPRPTQHDAHGATTEGTEGTGCCP